MYQLENLQNTEIVWGDVLFQRWAAHIDGASSTVRSYTMGAKKFMQWIQDECRAFPPCRDDITDYKSYLIAENYSATTIATYLISVRALLSWLEDEGFCRNVAKNVKAPRIEKGFRKDCLTLDECRKVIGSIDKTTERGARDVAIIVLMMVCGMRTIEIVRANTGDIRRRNGKHVLYVQGKGHVDTDDYIVLPDSVLEILQNYLSYRTQYAENSPLFVSVSNSNQGERMTTRSISRIAKNAMKNAGIDDPRLTAHSMRHTAITVALERTGNIEDVREFARHASIRTTMIYAHTLKKEKNECSFENAAALFDQTKNRCD